jgi:hypothetical protein
MHATQATLLLLSWAFSTPAVAGGGPGRKTTQAHNKQAVTGPIAALLHLMAASRSSTQSRLCPDSTTRITACCQVLHLERTCKPFVAGSTTSPKHSQLVHGQHRHLGCVCCYLGLFQNIVIRVPAAKQFARLSVTGAVIRRNISRTQHGHAMHSRHSSGASTSCTL